MRPRTKVFFKRCCFVVCIIVAIITLIIVLISLFGETDEITVSSTSTIKNGGDNLFIQFRKVCNGWHATSQAKSRLSRVEIEPPDILPRWHDMKELEKFCAPYTVMYLRPSKRMLVSGGKECETKPNNNENALCRKYPLCMLSSDEDAISRTVNKTGIFEEEHLFEMQKALNKDCFVLDGGANQGIYTVWAALLGHKVTAFEADPRFIKVLSKSIALLGLTKSVSLYHNALGHRAETLLLDNDEQIEQITIDDALEDIQRRHKGQSLGYMKLALDGNEARFFTGGVDFLQYYRPRIFQMEINTEVAERSTWRECNCELFERLWAGLKYDRTDIFWQENATFCQRSETFGESTFERN
jgi:FkbM family methyltransferase